MERRVVGESRENLLEPTPRGRMLKVMGGPGNKDGLPYRESVLAGAGEGVSKNGNSVPCQGVAEGIPMKDVAGCPSKATVAAID